MPAVIHRCAETAIFPATVQGPSARRTLAAWLLLLVGLLLLAVPVRAQSAPTPDKIVRICGSEEAFIHEVFVDILKHAYEHIGYRVEIIMAPNVRSLRLANEGMCQGEIMRVAQAEQKYPNLKLVPVSINKLEAFAYTVNTTKPIKGWGDLKDLHTYIRLGSIYAEEGTRGMNVGKVKTTTQMFQMLHDGKIDVAVEIYEPATVVAAREFPGSAIHPIGAPLASVPMYHLIHRDSAHLIPLLEQTFTQMIASGELKMLKARALQQLIDHP